MSILKTQSEFGHCPPPETPYAIVTNLPGWDLAKAVRDGDMEPFSRIVHIYPRFGPTHFVGALAAAVVKKLGLDGKGCMLYHDPIMWTYTTGHVAHEERKEHAITADKLTFKVVDVGKTRLYAVLYDPQYTKAIMLSWGTPGIGISIREAEELLKDADNITEVPFSADAPPPPTYTPEGASHAALRQRIVEFLHHGAIRPDKVTAKTSDVFLYPTGMAAVFRCKNLLEEYRPGANVELGIVFHNTHELLHEESVQEWKHIGRADKQALDDLEAWLPSHKTSFVYVEVPGNPTLESVDLPRLKRMSETHGFVLIVDDTVAGYANVDVLEYSDILLTSLTKSFSGRSDVMGGCVVLNPLSPHCTALSSRFTESFRNELHVADADVLLANSQDYFERNAVLNDNARAMAEFLHSKIGKSPVTEVQYPSLSPSKPHYDAVKRRSTAELKEPGYGCLFTVVFDSVDATRAFYDRLGFYPSPHLGGHVTIMLPYNMFMFGKDPEERERMRGYSIVEESVRISAGLEKREDLIASLEDALAAASEVKTKGAE